MPYANLSELKEGIAPALTIHENSVEVKDTKALRDNIIDRLAKSAALGSDEVKDAARWIIWSASQALGAGSASIQGLYDAMGRSEVDNLSVPAINIRGLTYEVARAVFRAALSLETGPILFEIARSEIGYTEQRPAEYTAAVLAASIKEGWNLPVLLQGDHFQVNLKKYKEDPDQEMQTVKDLTQEAIEAGFYNIDVDTSTLVDLDQSTLEEQQRNNYERCGEITHLIREIEPKGVTVSVGGEIGEVGGKNSTVEEFQAFMEGFEKSFPNLKGISKISVQTGTSHGGVPLPDGSVAQVKLDFDVLAAIGKAAREQYGISGAVQHGASTLPDEAFYRFPQSVCSEIHLATGFQNIIYDHPSFPAKLREKIYTYLREACASEKKDGQTDEQFIYKTRKKGFGPHKKELMNLSPGITGPIMKDLEAKFRFLFEKLGTRSTIDLLRRHVLPVPVAMPKPEGL